MTTIRKRPVNKPIPPPQVAHKVTQSNIDVVTNLARIGVPHETIAAAIGTSDKSLRKYYREVLDKSMAQANATIAGVVYKMATAGPDVPAADRLKAAIYWAKVRIPEMRERKEPTEVVGVDGAPVAVGGKFTIEFVEPDSKS